jgi:hypothetical protein
VESNVEIPLLNTIENIKTTADAIHAKNKLKIQECMKALLVEEENAYKMKKKKKREIQLIQESLSTRMKITREIQRLEKQNLSLRDSLSQAAVPKMSNMMAEFIPTQLQAYETILEGISKVNLELTLQLRAKRDKFGCFMLCYHSLSFVYILLQNDLMDP